MSHANRRSAANAIRHGYAAIYHVRKEDEPQLQAIRESLGDSYRPTGHREIDLVYRLSVATLKRQRMEEDMEIRLERETRNAPLHHTRQCDADLRKLLGMLRRSPVNASELLYNSYFGARHVHHLWCTMLENLAEGHTYKAGLKLVTELIRISGSHTDIEAISGDGRIILLCHLSLSGHAESEVREYIIRGMPKMKAMPNYHRQLISQYTVEATQLEDAHETLLEMVKDNVDSWCQRVDELAPIHDQDLQDFIATEAGRGLGDSQLIKQFLLHERYYSRTLSDIRRIESELCRRQMRREFSPESKPGLDLFSDAFDAYDKRDSEFSYISINPDTPADNAASEPATELTPVPEKAAATDVYAIAEDTASPVSANSASVKTQRIACDLVDDSGLLRLRKRYKLQKSRVNELMAVIRLGEDPFMDFSGTAMVYVAMPLDHEAFADLSAADKDKFFDTVSHAICEIMEELQNKPELYRIKEATSYEVLYLMAQWGVISVEEYNELVANLDRLAM